MVMKRPPLREWLSLFRASIAVQGVTTANGALAGNSFVDAGLIGAGANSFVSMLAVINPGDPMLVDSMDITAFNNVTGEVTLHENYKGGQILAGTPYIIVTFRFVPAEVPELLADVGNASASTLGSLYAILGNPAVDLATQIAAIDSGGFQEQPETAVNINAIAGGETDFLNLAAAGTHYIVRDVELKCADPGANTVTVRLYKLVNGALTMVDTFDITAANFATYFSLMDIFGRPHLAGDQIQITVRASAGGPYAVTGQYSHGKTNV